MDSKKEAARQLAILERGCEELLPRELMLAKLERSLETGKPLRVKMGIDPTARDIHIGHMVPYGKLGQFQDLGHHAVLIIGDYTASIGDPSGRNAERPPLSRSQITQNAEAYAEQIFRIVDRDRAELRWQSEWFTSLSLAQILQLAGSFSLAQLLAHETFRKRYEDGVRVGLHELFYPILQAYDSVVVQADVELGGSDQKFNILAGRDLQKDLNQEAQCLLVMPLLPGLDGRKMSKSFGNDVPVGCPPVEQFSRIMAIADEHIARYRLLVLGDSEEACAGGERRIADGENPFNLKKELASRIVDRLNGTGSGAAAQIEWERQFSQKEAPSDIEVFILKEAMPLSCILRESALCASASDGRRLIAQGAVYLNDTRVDETDPVLNPAELADKGTHIRIGRRRHLQLRS